MHIFCYLLIGKRRIKRDKLGYESITRTFACGFTKSGFRFICWFHNWCHVPYNHLHVCKYELSPLLEVGFFMAELA